ncbi:MAG: EpsG family protein [Clostridia bacterium]|nr:EpsG family protein [Clostridia bacterium]
MLGYIVAIGLITVWYYICKNTGDKNHKSFLIGTAILMTLFYGLRGQDVGSDTVSYIAMFLEDGSVPLSGLWDYMWKEKSPAYVLLEWLFYQILPFPQLWLLATSAFFFFIFSNFIKKNSVDPYFSYLIFFTIFGTFQMTGIRQSCAMAVLMLAFEQIKEKRPVKYLLLIGLAYLFHKSSIVFLPFYIIGKRRITDLDIPIFTVGIVAIYANRAFVFDLIKSFTSYNYFEQLNHNEPVNFSIMIYGTTLLALLLCVVLTSRKKRQLIEQYDLSQNANIYSYSKMRRLFQNDLLRQEVRKDGELSLYSQYANAMILASLFMPLVAINGAVRRIVMYFALFMILLLPKVFREFMDPQIRRVCKIILGVILTYLLLSGVKGSSYEYYLFF